MDWLNYHHLHYFWVVAREGSIVRACEVLHLSQPTISTQLQQLEQSLGGKLFERAGRGLKLTELGQTVFTYADEIFALGKQLLDTAKGRPTGQPLRLVVGVSDVLAKLVVYRLLQPALRMPERVCLICREGNTAELLTSLAAYELDLMLSDAPLASGSRVKAFSHLLGECGITIFGKPALKKKYATDFPRSLHGAPMLLPFSSTNTRRLLDQWFDDAEISPMIEGEFEDSALMKVFGQEGLGLFPAPSVIENELCEQYGVQVVGRIDQVRERFYAISVERKLKNPAAVEISRAARSQIFAPKAEPPK
ncbi:transcriptional regulator, LysR family [Pirellula staleyi DSM 6068]|uniref:Transcriptional regulator, LysR family n=1 Tax=Pirellula staleyi (strain ATCC 27377 / DSM 6068 / ICPB 4128) TaxID=530564 RepID=D2R8H1_PIRSD|nr:transcriptional activator NhaR [Pirellula staleyi]ADB15788.1 transcriptional regulator, LysR family [Pirellula staleyi DSM 6068]